MTKNDQVAMSTIVTNAIQATVPNMIKSVIQATVPSMIKEVVQDLFDQNLHAFKRDIRDEIYSANKALENSLRREIQTMRTEIVSDIGGILDGSILPQIAELQYDVSRLKERVGV